MKLVLIKHNESPIIKQPITDECFLKLKNKIEDMYIENILSAIENNLITVELLKDDVLIIKKN